MRTPWVVGIVAACICLSGCLHFYTSQTAPAELVAFAQDRQKKGRAVQDLLWYLGREGDYDYFKYVWAMAAEKMFRITVDQSPITHPFPYSDDYREWVPVRRSLDGSLEKWQPPDSDNHDFLRSR